VCVYSNVILYVNAPNEALRRQVFDARANGEPTYIYIEREIDIDIDICMYV